MGKGSKQRPRLVSRARFDRGWSLAFHRCLYCGDKDVVWVAAQQVYVCQECLATRYAAAQEGKA